MRIVEWRCGSRWSVSSTAQPPATRIGRRHRWLPHHGVPGHGRWPPRAVLSIGQPSEIGLQVPEQPRSRLLLPGERLPGPLQRAAVTTAPRFLVPACATASTESMNETRKGGKGASSDPTRRRLLAPPLQRARLLVLRQGAYEEEPRLTPHRSPFLVTALRGRAWRQSGCCWAPAVLPTTRLLLHSQPLCDN